MRFLFSLPFAALVTVILFAIMAYLISQDEIQIGQPKPAPDIDITADIPPEEPTRNEPAKPDQLPEPPPPPNRTVEKSENPGDGFDPGGPTEINTDPGDIDGNPILVQPTVRIAPQYPSTCQSRGAEGAVIVQFDVSPEGNVINPVIVESADRCFNRTVINAVSQWKYAPAYENGKPVVRRGVTERFSFTLEDN